MISDNDFFYDMISKLKDKYNLFKKEKWYELLKSDEDFSFFVSLVYMCLSKEMIIEKVINPSLPGIRLQPLVDDPVIDELFNDVTNYSIINTTNTDKVWILNTIRNSILHRHFFIDYANKVLKINNVNRFGALECDLSFSWFNKYADMYFPKNGKVEEDSLTYFVDCNYVRGMFFPKELSKLKEYFYKCCFLKIIAHDKNNDSVEQEKLAKVLDFVRYEIIPLIDFTKLYEKIMDDLLKKTNSANYSDFLLILKDEFINAIIDKIVNEFSLLKDENGFSNFDISVSNVEVNDAECERIFNFIDSSDLDESSKNYNKFVELLQFYFNNSRSVSILNCMGVLHAFLSLTTSDKFPDEVMESLLKDEGFDSLHEAIHHLRTHDEDTYDGILLSNLDIEQEDFLRIQQEFDVPYYSISLGLLNNTKVGDLYNKYTELLRKSDEISDQDLSFSFNNEIFHWTFCMDYIKSHYYYLEISILYLMGLGIFSINKDLMDQVDFSTLDLSGFTGTVFNRRSASFVPASDSQIFRVIRNCFSHPNRIKISNDDSRKVTLVDVDNLGNVSANIVTSIDELLKLFTNEQIVSLIEPVSIGLGR